MRNSFYIGYKGRLEAYIYIWFSKEAGLVYVGETNNIHGVVGRANQHIDNNTGTLYERVFEKGYNLDTIDDFMLLSYPLPRKKEYISEETSWRISVEYMVHKMLIERRKYYKPSYDLISKVVVGPYSGMYIVRELAEKIVNDFCEVFIE